MIIEALNSALLALAILKTPLSVLPQGVVGLPPSVRLEGWREGCRAGLQKLVGW